MTDKRMRINQALNIHIDDLEDVLLKINELPEAFWDEWGDAEILRRIVCNHMGHDFIDDHCGKPEHRFCSTCFKKEVSDDQ